MQTFPLSPAGHITHWLSAGPKETLLSGPMADEETLIRTGVDSSIVIPPDSASLVGNSPLDTPWQYRYQGNNFFCEFSAFYHRITGLGYLHFHGASRRRGGAA